MPPADDLIEPFHRTAATGRRLIDGDAEFGTLVHGRSSARIAAAVEAGEHRAADVAASLLKLAPKGLNHILIWDSPRAALEGAIRMIAAVRGASRFLALDYDDVAATTDALVSDPGTIAGVLAEPAVRTAGRISVAAPGILRTIRDLCDEHGVPLIADETIVGCGRTGFLWACTRDGISPDLLVAGAGLAAGFAPIGATLASDAVAAGWTGDVVAPSPNACAAAVASLDMLDRDNFLGEVRRKAANLTDLLLPLGSHPAVIEVAQRGLFAAVRFRGGEAVARSVALAAPDHGALVRVLADAVVLTPPLAIPDDLLAGLARAVVAAAGEAESLGSAGRA